MTPYLQRDNTAHRLGRVKADVLMMVTFSLVTFVLAGCTEESNKTEELQRRIVVLEKELQDKDAKLQAKDMEIFELRVPDKAAFQKIESEWAGLGGAFMAAKEPPVSPDEISKLIQKYFDFQMQHRSSPLVANAQEKIKLLRQEVERQSRIAEKDKLFATTPKVSSTEVHQYPERYLNQTIQVSGYVRIQGPTGYSIDSLPIRTRSNEQSKFFSHLVDGQPRGGYTTLIIALMRDEKLTVYGDLIEVR